MLHTHWCHDLSWRWTIVINAAVSERTILCTHAVHALIQYCLDCINHAESWKLIRLKNNNNKKQLLTQSEAEKSFFYLINTAVIQKPCQDPQKIV